MEFPMKTLRPLGTPQTLAEQTADALRDQILAGQLRSGERLVEAGIAIRLGISRGPVREAIKQLREEGLVRLEPRRGAFVSSLTIGDIRDIYDLRVALEARAATLIVRNGDPAAIGALRRSVGRIEEAARDGHFARLAKSDYEFHDTVCRLTDNRRIHDAFVRNSSALRMVLRLEGRKSYEPFEAVWEQHRELVDVLTAGDSDRAAALFTEHIEEARDRLIGALVEAATSQTPVLGAE
jgi:DNA-binding GntR family transcriptional regulator